MKGAHVIIRKRLSSSRTKRKLIGPNAVEMKQNGPNRGINEVNGGPGSTTTTPGLCATSNRDRERPIDRFWMLKQS
ncbi:hypothetical protein VNO77_16758 [Canavalia gladiata]|uniref:Uncharacterized protein n=1 Tax=Canavalia gladiata TaxID=3824 RepID=A0AAN9LLC2_CANGL